MRKFRFLVLMLLVGLLALPAGALEVDDLSRLGDYYPAETPIFFTIRTDDAYIDTLEEVLARANEVMPGVLNLPGRVDLQALASGVTSVFGGDFEAVVRSWLGDTAAIGFTETEFIVTGDEPDFYIAFSVTDRAAAQEVLDGVVEFTEDEVEISESNGYNVYEIPSQDLALALGDDVLFLAIDADDLPLTTLETPLTSTTRFTEAVTALPGDDYNFLLYIDTAALNEANLAISAQAGLPLPESLTRFITASESQALAGTIQDGDTLILDWGIPPVNLEGLEGLYSEVYVPSPADLSFAANIPADAAAVIHGSDFGPINQAAFDQLRAFSDYIAEEEIIWEIVQASGAGMFLPPEVRPFLQAIRPDIALPILSISFAGLTGLSVEYDINPTLNGDWATYLRVIPSEGGMLPVLPDLGMLVAGDDAEAVDGLVQQLIRATELYGSLHTVEETPNGGTALALSTLRELAEVPNPAFDLMFAAEDGLFLMGLRPTVEQAASVVGGLDETDAFTNAGAYLLDDAQQVWYVATQPLDAALRFFIEAGLGDPEELRTLRTVLLGVESMTLSSVAEENSAVIRLTLTLAEEPAEALGDGE